MTISNEITQTATPRTGVFRTLAILFCGMLLTQFLSGIIASAIVPKLGAIVLYRYNPALEPSMRGHEQEIQRGMLLLRYVADPLAGLAVGVFVGFFQRNKAALVAAICWMPEVLLLIFGTRFLQDPVAGITQIIPGKLITIGCSSLTAYLVWLVKNRP